MSVALAENVVQGDTVPHGFVWGGGVCAADRELVEREVQIPGLDLLLDNEALLKILRERIGQPIQSINLTYLRFKPGQNCLAAYTLKTGGDEVLCYAKAVHCSERFKLARIPEPGNVSGPFGAGRFGWVEKGLEVSVFPHDHRLAGLRFLGNSEIRKDFLQRHLPAHPKLWESTIQTLAYKPERRWVGALVVDGIPRAACKLYTRESFPGVYARTKQLRSHGISYSVPLIGRSKGRQVLFFAWQPGTLLSDALRTVRFDVATIQEAGKVLGQLHLTPPGELPCRSVADWQEKIQATCRLLVHLLPNLSKPLRQLGERLSRGAQWLGSDATLHGDFHAGQVIRDISKTVFLDLDEASRGDRHFDLAAFLAYLEREHIVGRITREFVAETELRLLEGYHQVAPPTSPKMLKWCLAERLFARAPEFFRTHTSNWPAHTEALIVRVQELLEAAEGGGKTRRPLDPKLPSMEVVLSPEAIQPSLFAMMREQDVRTTAVRVQHVKLRRHKPGRRALFEFGIETDRAGLTNRLSFLGKMRRRGVDFVNTAIWRQLMEKGFSADSADGVSVPEIVGTLDDYGMTIQQQVEGQSFDVLLAMRESAWGARRAAHAIVKLHQTKVAPLKIHSIKEELAILEAHLDRVASTRTDWSDRLNSLMHKLRVLAASLPEFEPCLIHRDFYHDQVLFHGSRVWLLDLDLLCGGDPALDAGNFIGHLMEWGLRCPAQRSALNEAAAAFCARFLELQESDLNDAVEIYTTLTLARHISLSGQFKERQSFTQQILELCESRCACQSNPNPLANH